MEFDVIVKALKAVSDPSRLRIIEILSCGELRACELLIYFDFSQPSLSHHLKTLWEANILKKSRDGKWITYSINEEFLEELSQEMARIFAMDKSPKEKEKILEKKS